MTAKPSVITLQGVSRRFRTARTEIYALSEINLDIREGEFVTVVGPSGCGKSTVLNIIVGLLDPTTGTRLFRGVSTNGINLEIGYVTQQDNLFPWRTVLGNVTFALEMRQIGTSASRRDHAMELIERVGLKGFEHHYRHELSGGMRQRVNIIRALIYNPKVILLDEPFGPLDAQTRLQLQDLLLKLWVERAETTLVFITPDLSEAIALADRVVVMSARPGRVREIVNVDLPRPRDIYTIHTDAHFREIYDRIWQHLADEMRMAS
jgi:NitT/TauT family transport system ATP-binding protein